MTKALVGSAMNILAGELGSPVFDGQRRAMGRLDESWKSLFFSAVCQALKVGSKEYSVQPSVFRQPV